MELEGRSHSESAMQQPDHQGADPSDTRPEEVRRPTERRTSGNYYPEIWGGVTEVCKAVLAESFGVKVISYLLSVFRFNVGLDVRLLLPLSSSVFPFTM